MSHRRNQEQHHKHGGCDKRPNRCEQYIAHAVSFTQVSEIMMRVVFGHEECCVGKLRWNREDQEACKMRFDERTTYGDDAKQYEGSEYDYGKPSAQNIGENE